MKEPKCYLSEHPRLEATQEFIDRNRFSLSRTQDEIVGRIGDNSDYFGFSAEVLFEYLDLDRALPLMPDEGKESYATGKEWVKQTDLLDATQDFLDYMNFAWGKAEDERGISASRSINKLSAWLWLFGRDDLRRLIDDDELYNPYGAPALIAVCDELGIETPESLQNFAEHKC